MKVSPFELIKKLQTSGDKYTILECGSGSAVINLLMSVPGASALINKGFQLYSKESQVEFIGPFKRSVSVETVMQAMKVIKGPCVVTQFQLQGTDLKVLTHGYIGVRGEHGEKIYHISVYKNNYEPEYDELFESVEIRKNEFDLIAETAIKMMYHYSVDSTYELSNLWIDGVFSTDTGVYQINETLSILGNSDKTDTFIPFNNEWSRAEDLIRGKDGLILMRGSFNPVHSSHIEMLELTKKKYPNYETTFLISLHNRDKDNVSSFDAITRATVLKKLGYNVLFSSLPYFNDSLRTLRNRWPELTIIFPVGTDTINRFLEDIIKTEKDLHESFNSIKIGPQLKLEEKEPIPWDDNLLGKTKTAFEIFHGDKWVKANFLVFERQGYDLHPNAKYFSNIIELDFVYKDVNGTSSTKIRNGEQKNPIHETLG